MQPLLIHHHLPKTAGSSLRQVVRANFERGEVFYGNPPALTMPESGPVNLSDTGSSVRNAFLSSWRDWYESLTVEEQARLGCVGSHSAQFLIPAIHNRPVRPFTVLRDPVDRVVSLYHYSLASWRRSRHEDALSRDGRRVTDPPSPLPPGTLGRKLDEYRWSLADVYRELGCDGALAGQEVFSLFFNGQTLEILSPHFDSTELPFGPVAADLEEYRRRAFDVLSTYVVGTQDRFSESVRLFADSFGWSSAFAPRRNVGSDRTAVDEQTRSLIRAHNSIDTGLHAHYSARLEGRAVISLRENAWWKARERGRSARAKAHRAARSHLVRAVRLRRG